MIRTGALVLLAGIALAAAARAAELAAPDPRLTPGTIVSNDRETACTLRATPRLYQTNRSVYFDQARQVGVVYYPSAAGNLGSRETKMIASQHGHAIVLSWNLS